MRNLNLFLAFMANFLHPSPLLSSAHPLAKVNPLPMHLIERNVFNYEQVPAVEKTISEKHGDLVIGDMIIPRSQISTSSGMVRKEWPNGIVPYKIHSSVTDNADRLKSVQAGIFELNSNTCISLQPATSSDTGYILITAEKSGCFAVLGYTGREQVVNLGRGCYRKGTVVHEIAHALGFFHEHSRDDRDSFVKINLENIQLGKESQFRKTSDMTRDAVSFYGVPYNYESVMHYSPTAFTISSNTYTIQSLNNSNGMGNPKQMGQRSGLSEGDVRMINEKYKYSQRCR